MGELCFRLETARWIGVKLFPFFFFFFFFGFFSFFKFFCSLACSVALRICLRSGACLPYISPAACMANEMQMSSPPIWLERPQRNHFSKPPAQWITKWSVSCKMGNPRPLPLPSSSHQNLKGKGEQIYMPANLVTARSDLPCQTHTLVLLSQ